LITATDDVAVEQIIRDVGKQGFSILKTDHTVQLAEAARQAYLSLFNALPLSGRGFSYHDLVTGPIRKKNISSSTGLGEPYAQVFQATYFHETYPNAALSGLFQYLISVRNRITHLPHGFGSDPVQDGMWNACRIHHYPQGGGFIVGHRDTHFPTVLGERGYIQTLYLLSRKGVDFHTGGGFISDLSGNRIDIETEAGFGAMVFFDSRILHGVADVDPLDNFSMERKTGRLAALANVYEYRG
jgi:hypothetical protein